MTGPIRVREQARDDELGIIRKRVTFPGGFEFESPSRSIARSSSGLDVVVNEIPRQIAPGTVVSLEKGTSNLFREIKAQFIPNALNLSIFDLKFDVVPPPSAIRTIASYLYSVSDKVVTLPTVKSGLLKDPARPAVLSDSRIADYIQMMNLMIDEIGRGNGKPVIGTVPLIPAKFSRQIIQAYFDKGVEAFAIDAGTKDIFLNEPDFLLILSEISQRKPVNETFIYACNLGFPRYEKQYIRADDFLGLFAYIDVLGGMFKTRGGPINLPGAPRTFPRAKRFLRERYAYEISDYQELSRVAGRKISSTELANQNQRLQLAEANHVRPMIGEESIREYVSSKPAVDGRSLDLLISIAKGRGLR
jgi:hypothetical protein